MEIEKKKLIDLAEKVLNQYRNRNVSNELIATKIIESINLQSKETPSVSNNEDKRKSCYHYDNTYCDTRYYKGNGCKNCVHN